MSNHEEYKALDWYTRTGHFVEAAWFTYRKHYRGAGVPSCASFVAGWNAAKADNKRETLADRLHDGRCGGNQADVDIMAGQDIDE